jgi:aminoglycoside 6'-N-acetyltransferase
MAPIVSRKPQVDRIRSVPAAHAVKLRPATPDDLELLRRWDEQPHVVASKGDDDWQWESELARNPDWREQLIAETDGRAIGFVQIIDPCREDSQYWGCVKEGRRAIDIWLGDPADLGKGYGTAIMKLAIERCFADPEVATVLVDPMASNNRAHRFYERLGFNFKARRTFGDDDCIVYSLARPEPATERAVG